LYPVIVKKFASEKKADPLIFSFYRDMFCFPLLFICALIVERKLMFPHIKMLVVSVLLCASSLSLSWCKHDLQTYNNLNCCKLST